MSFNVTVNAAGAVDGLNHLAAAYAQESVSSLEQVADGIIANIKRRRIWAKETVGTLKQGLWRGAVRSRQSGAEIDLGWSGKGAAFGPGHEFGFKKKSWVVKPVGTRVSTTHSDKRIGLPIVALRFQVGGKVVYSRGPITIHPPKVLKPHFQPALDAYPVDKVMGDAMDRAVKRSGL